MLILEVFARTWLMWVVTALIGLSTAWVVLRVRFKFLDYDVRAAVSFWIHLAMWFLLITTCLTLIDRPFFDWDEKTMAWLFMFSAFLGIPITVPLATGTVWSLSKMSSGGKAKLSELFFLGLAGFGLGCAALNIHDIIWCDAITNWFTAHYRAGFDLDLFVLYGRLFGINEGIMRDYATLGLFAGLLVLCELAISAAAFSRLRTLPSQKQKPSPDGSDNEIGVRS